MNEPETIRKILAMRTVAVVGLSNNPLRPSFNVAKYLQEHGYSIIPVNPTIKEWEGKKSYPNLASVGTPIDVVCVFRKPEEAQSVARDSAAIGAKAVWLQEGITSEGAAQIARQAGILFIQDRCMMKEHTRARD
jgi:predicted CoA-binding protein